MRIKMLYKLIDGVHFFLGLDNYSLGVRASHPDYGIALRDAGAQLRRVLRLNHNQTRWVEMVEHKDTGIVLWDAHPARYVTEVDGHLLP